MQRSRVALVVSIVLVSLGSPATAAPAEERWSPPVDGPVVRGYEPPQRPFGPQHLGLDYAVEPGSPGTVYAASTRAVRGVSSVSGAERGISDSGMGWVRSDSVIGRS